MFLVLTNPLRYYRVCFLWRILLCLCIVLYRCGEKENTLPAAARPTDTPKRIALTNLFSAKVFLQLGQLYQQRVVSLPYTIDNPKYSDMVGKWPASISRSTNQVESILLTQPDLVIMASFHDIYVRTMVHQSGIPVILLRDFDGFAAYRYNVRLIASELGAEQYGERIIQNFDQRLQYIRKLSKKLPQGLTCISYFYGNVAGNRSTFHDIIESVGLTNLAHQKGISYFKKVSIETIILWNPNIIIIGCRKSDCGHTVTNFVSSTPSVRHTSAFRNNGILAIPAQLLTSTSDNMLRAALLIQSYILTKYAR